MRPNCHAFLGSNLHARNGRRKIGLLGGPAALNDLVPIMKLCRHGPRGREKPGLVAPDGTIRDLSGVLEDLTGVADLAGPALAPRNLAKIRKVNPEKLPKVSSRVRIGACVGGTRNFIAVGLNYVDHANETGAPIPNEPILFNKAPNCIVGPNDDVMIPKGSKKTDWEVEIAVVIGQGALRRREGRADATSPATASATTSPSAASRPSAAGQWMKGKGCETFGPLGPWLVTPDEIKDVQNLDMSLDVNGERMQTGTTTTMIFGVAALICLHQPVHGARARRRHHHRHAARRRLGKKPPKYLKAGRRHLARHRRARRAVPEGGGVRVR